MNARTKLRAPGASSTQNATAAGISSKFGSRYNTTNATGDNIELGVSQNSRQVVHVNIVYVSLFTKATCSDVLKFINRETVDVDSRTTEK